MKITVNIFRSTKPKPAQSAAYKKTARGKWFSIRDLNDINLVQLNLCLCSKNTQKRKCL